jgi:outer membrane protein
MSDEDWGSGNGKSMQKMKRLLLICFLLVCAGLFAETISLEDARLLALANSRSLAKYNLAIKGAVLEEKSLLYSNLPSLSLGASAGMSLWSAEHSAPIENPFDTFSAGASVSVSQKLFEGGRFFVQKAIATIATESARIDAQAEYFNVLESAENAYYTVLEAEATLEAEESGLKSSLASLSMAEIRQASGMINQGDYLKALAEKEARENSRNQARRNLAMASAKLKFLTGLTGSPQLEQIDFSRYEDLIVYLGGISDAEADSLYVRFWRLLESGSPSLAKAALAKERADKNLAFANRGYSPSLSASFSTGLNYTQQGGVERSGGRVSLSASIPVDFWVMSNNVEKSKITRDSAALDYLSAGIQLETELQSALLSAFAYAGSVLSFRRSLEYAEKHFEYVSERYRLSQSSISDYGDASLLLINSRNNYIKASYGFLMSLSKLRFLEAIDDEERLAGILMGS